MTDLSSHELYACTPRELTRTQHHGPSASDGCMRVCGCMRSSGGTTTSLARARERERERERESERARERERESAPARARERVY